ncbi:MAG TPA: ATP-binding protein [Usitatibacter sp.]|jgi:signal transduction histidine kinase/ActR/RegA family two-component response regulator|nr:ATP-binding protein [Usitatibacter sp.]
MSAQTTSIAGAGKADPRRQALAYVTFAVVYYVLAAYAMSLPVHTRFPLVIWPAHGLALGVLLVAPIRRWPWYLLLVALATAAVGFDMYRDMQMDVSRVLASMAVNVAQPLFVAAGLLRLAGPRVQVDTVKGVASFLVGMAPLVGGMAILDAGFTYLHTSAPFRESWSVTFVSTMLGMLISAPLVLAWSRKGLVEALEMTRAKLPELLVLYGGLIITTNYVFGSQPTAPGFIPPLIYLCAPFLIWAALRFGMRTTTLALAIFGLICFWQTAHGFGPFSVDRVADVRSMLHLQGYLATIVVTTLFSAALLVEREEAIYETGAWRNRHEAVIRASGNLLYELDPTTGAVLWDGDTRSVLGVTPDRISTVRQWMERVHPEDRIRLKGLRRVLMSGSLSHIAIEYRFRKDDGEYTTLGVNAYRIGDPTGDNPAERRVIGFVKDVAEKLRAESERERLEAQLKQAEKMQAVGHLAGGIAHDFNNILGAILGYGELAQRRAEGDADMKRYLDTIMGAGNRAKSLVTQILSYSRAEGVQKMPVLVAPIAQEVCELVRGSTPLAIDVVFRNNAGDDAMVLGDPTRLHQLLMNFSTNAIHAMDQGGTLEVSLDAEVLDAPRKVRTGEIKAGEYIRISVRDSGHGIAPEVIDRIFEPFFTTKPAGRGTGLGLALVHSVVSEHKGFIEVKSELGKGTTFTVWIPATHAAEGVGEEETEMPMGAGQVILAVDDEVDVLHALEEMLAQLGYEPVGFNDSREALEAVRANPRGFDAIVSDEVMPQLIGTQLALEVHKVNPGMPIVIASGYGGAGFEARALSAGVNRVLRKPYRMSEIAEALATFFAQSVSRVD